jgi:hypothetical protein
MYCCCCPGLEIIYEATTTVQFRSHAWWLLTSLLRKSHLYSAEMVIARCPRLCIKGFSFYMEWCLTLDKNGAPGNVFICQKTIYLDASFIQCCSCDFSSQNQLPVRVKNEGRSRCKRKPWALFEGRHQEMLFLYYCKKIWSLKRIFSVSSSSLAWMLNSWTQFANTITLWFSPSFLPFPGIWSWGR